MDIKEFLLLYVPYKDKIDSLIPDDVIREYILSEVLSRTCFPYEQTKKILHHEFFCRYDNDVASLVTLYSFVSNLYLSEFWNYDFVPYDDRVFIADNCAALLDMVDEFLISYVMSLSGYVRITNQYDVHVWTR
ncbi:unknown [Firmicutes bacterium CAG:882]|nr:unknown [Firmicutes bacterium CAG:882]